MRERIRGILSASRRVLRMATEIPYAERIAARADKLHRETIATQKEIISSRRALDRARDEMRQEFAMLRGELAALDAALGGTVQGVTASVHAFQRVAKRHEFVRLQQRIDAWAPERKLSRDAFKRMIEDN